MADVLGATFPPGSVTGAPKIAAQRGIADLEDEPRGAYTGSIGLVSPLAGADFNVIIRSFELADGRLQLGVGGGITVDSVPMREWYECLHKAAPLVAAAGSTFDHELPTKPVAADPTLLASGVFESSWSREARSFVWLPILPAWTDRAASCTDTGFQMILPARRTTSYSSTRTGLGSPFAFSPGPPKVDWTSSWTLARSVHGRSARRCAITCGPIARGDTSGSSGRRWMWQRRR